MPAKSEKQRRLMAIALHEPGKLYRRNRDVAKMDKEDLHDFASTKGKQYRKALKRKKRGK